MTEPIVLAFSGGLDTSYCVPWLAETYGRPVVTVTVDTGGIRLHGFFISPDRATGTLTRTVGHCAIAGAQWTARLAD